MKPCISFSILAAIACYTYVIFSDTHSATRSLGQLQKDGIAAEQALQEAAQKIKDTNSQIASLQAKLGAAQENLQKEQTLLATAQQKRASQPPTAQSPTTGIQPETPK